MRDKTAQALEHLKQQVAIGADDRPLLSIRIVGSTAPVVAHLTALGASVHLTSAKHGVIEAWVSIDDLPAVAQIKGVLSVSPAYKPIRLAGSVQSQGDQVVRADVVRSNGITGSPFLIGVLSDSALNLAASQASNDLPAVVDRYLEFPAEDEGRAMLEIIHDLAPGARLAHHSGLLSELSFADGIRELAQAGSKVIVDDLCFFKQPFFQDGILAQTADEVAGNGVLYVSAAGNQGDSSYEAVFNEDPATHFHDFDPGPATDIFQQITFTTVPPGNYKSTLTLVLQWDDPFTTTNGVTHDFDVFIYDAAGSNQLASSTNDNITNQEPIEVLQWTRVNGDPTVANIAIKRVAGSGPSTLKYVLFNALSIDEWHTHSGTIYGQAASTNTIAVGAVPFYAPTNIEPFSSRGNVTIYFDAQGNRLPTPEVRLKPDVVAPDQVNTTFFGTDISEDDDTWPNFPGTSAAAPHVAAVAGLILSANPHLTVAQLHEVLTSTAVDLGAPGPDPVFGYGLVDAEAARIAAASVPDTTPPTVRLLSPIPVPGWPVKQIKLQFSKPLNVATVTNTDNYSLAQAGKDGLFDTGDDVPYAVAADYDTNAYTVLLTFTSPANILTNGQYRLTLNSTNGLADPAGNLLNGGTNQVFKFSVTGKSSIVEMEKTVWEVSMALRADGTQFMAYPFDPVLDLSRWPQIMVGSFDAGAGSSGPFRSVPTDMVHSWHAYRADIAVSSRGGVIVYSDFMASHDYTIGFERLDTAGQAVGGRQQGSWASWENWPRVAMNEFGAFVLTYHTKQYNPASGVEQLMVAARCFTPGAVPVGETFTVSQQFKAAYPVVGMASNGASVFAWDAEWSEPHNVHARVLGANQFPLTDEFQVNETSAAENSQPDIAVGPDGDFAVVWYRANPSSGNVPGVIPGVYLRRYDAMGTPLGGEVLVFPYSWASNAQVGRAADGRLVVAWLSEVGTNNTGYAFGVSAQRFAADGSMMGDRLWVSEGLSDNATGVRLAVATNGDFVVRWSTDAGGQARWVAGDAPDDVLPWGPWVYSCTPNGPVSDSISNLLVSFNRPIDVTTFTEADLTLKDPQGLVISPVAVAAVAGEANRRFALSFTNQYVRGSYQLRVGPQIADMSGNLMNQNGNLVNGETADSYVGTVVYPQTVGTPQHEDFEGWSNGVPTSWGLISPGAGTVQTTTDGIPHGGGKHLRFHPNPGWDYLQSATLAVRLTNMTGRTDVFLEFWAKASKSYGSRLYVYLGRDGVTFPQQIAPSRPNCWSVTPTTDYTKYTLDLDAMCADAGIALGADVYIRFSYSSYYDEDAYLDDVRIVTSDLVGPKMLSHTPTSLAAWDRPLTNIVVTFNEAIDTTTFTSSDVSLNDPQGLAVNPIAVAAVAGSGSRQFALSYTNQYVRGTYRLTVGPQIADLSGNLMNQNGNAVNGEAEDYYAGTVVFAQIVGTNQTEDFENWSNGVPPYWSLVIPDAGTVQATSTGSPHGGSQHLKFSKSGLEPYATLAMNLGNLVGRTNVVLDFWAKASGSVGSALAIYLSGDGVTFLHVGSSRLSSSYTEYTLDLDALCASKGIALDSEVYVRFEYWSYYPYDGYLDDVRIFCGCYLVVQSAYGGASPPVGSNLFDADTLLSCQVTNSPVFNGTTQYVCAGWVGTGSVANGWGTNAVVTLTNDSTLVWMWGTNYWLDTGTNGSGTVDVADGWHGAGSNIVVTASNAPLWHFTGWTGDTQSCVFAGNMITAAMTQARSITANFAADQYNLTVSFAQGGVLPGTLTLGFTTQPGFNYTFQYRDNLVSGPDWQPVPGAPHNDGFLIITNTAPQRFYRLLIASP